MDPASFSSGSPTRSGDPPSPSRPTSRHRRGLPPRARAATLPRPARPRRGQADIDLDHDAHAATGGGERGREWSQLVGVVDGDDRVRVAAQLEQTLQLPRPDDRVGDRRSRTPAAAISSASPSFAHVRPIAPAATSRAPIAPHRWPLTCGRQATPAALQARRRGGCCPPSRRGRGTARVCPDRPSCSPAQGDGPSRLDRSVMWCTLASAAVTCRGRAYPADVSELPPIDSPVMLRSWHFPWPALDVDWNGALLVVDMQNYGCNPTPGWGRC